MDSFRFSKECVFKTVCRFSALISVLLTVSVFGFMAVLGFPLFQKGEFFNLLTGGWAPRQGVYGIYPMMVGTLSIAGLALIAAFPMSLGTACLISVLAPRPLGRFLRGAVRMMTGVPTVIFGFVGVFVLVPAVREVAGKGSGFCILSAAMMLAVLISPTMILFFTDSLDAVPISYRHAVDALGGNPVQKLIYVMFPWAWKGMLSGVILAGGRAVGDTLIALMLAGNAARVPGSVFESSRTLTAHIALVMAADYDSMEFKTIFACGIALYGLTILMIAGLRAIEKRRQNVNPMEKVS